MVDQMVYVDVIFSNHPRPNRRIQVQCITTIHAMSWMPLTIIQGLSSFLFSHICDIIIISDINM
jgi:hypothetical protein